MANVKPEQVFVVATVEEPDVTHATTFAAPPVSGGLYAFGDVDASGVVNYGITAANLAAYIPERIQFGVQDSVRTLRLSDYIRKGQVERYSFHRFTAKTPLVWTIDLSTIDDFNNSPNNSITLMISYRKTSLDFCMQKIQIILKSQGSDTDNAIELARLINESVTQLLTQSAWKPISAYVVGTVVYVHETQIPADFSGINTPNHFIFDLSESSSYKDADGIEADYWTQLKTVPFSQSIVRSFYDLTGASYPDYLVYNSSGNFWALASLPNAAYTTVTTTPILPGVGIDYPTNLSGNGLPILIKSHLRETDWGYNGVQNRTHYADTGYDTVVAGAIYDTHIIEYHELSQVEMGGSTARRKAKRLIMYVPNGDESTQLTTLINAFIGTPDQNRMHV